MFRYSKRILLSILVLFFLTFKNSAYATCASTGSTSYTYYTCGSSIVDYDTDGTAIREYRCVPHTKSVTGSCSVVTWPAGGLVCGFTYYQYDNTCQATNTGCYISEYNSYHVAKCAGTICDPVTGDDGVCGISNEGSFCYSDNITNQCNVGTGSEIISSDTGFTWNCYGLDGSCEGSAGNTDYCSATKLPSYDGICSTESVSTCDVGTVTNIGTSIVSTTPNEIGKINTWTCNGQCDGNSINCGTNGNFPYCTNKNIIDGACKSDVNSTDQDDLCYSGTRTPVTTSDLMSDTDPTDYINDKDETEYVWNCTGSRSSCAERDGTDQVNCYSDINQNAWFQINNGNILAKNKITNYIPRTTCNDRLNAIDCASTTNDGAIYSISSSLSTYDKSDKTENNNLNFENYTYSELKTDYFNTKGIGTTFGDNPSWSEIKNNTGIIFVDGNLEIDSNLITTDFVMIIAKGTITIESDVNQLNLVLVANKIIASTNEGSTENVNQLIINGIVYGITEVEFSRSLYPQNLNNTIPSVIVNYNPKLLFMLPNQLSQAFSQWRND